MKGSEFATEAMAMAVVFVLVVGVMYLWFTGEAEAGQSDQIIKEVTCETNVDCEADTTSAGKLCMQTGVPLPSLFCGCFDDGDCHLSTQTCGDDNRCH